MLDLTDSEANDFLLLFISNLNLPTPMTKEVLWSIAVSFSKSLRNQDPLFVFGTLFDQDFSK